MEKIVIVAFLIAIVIALGSGMVFLVKDTDGTRTVRALTWRIGLSVALIVVLVVGYWMGWITPHAALP